VGAMLGSPPPWTGLPRKQSPQSLVRARKASLMTRIGKLRRKRGCPEAAHVGVDLHRLDAPGVQAASPLLPAGTLPGMLDLPTAFSRLSPRAADTPAGAPPGGPKAPTGR